MLRAESDRVDPDACALRAGCSLQRLQDAARLGAVGEQNDRPLPLDAAGDLSKQAEQLTQEVRTFVAGVRAA